MKKYILVRRSIKDYFKNEKIIRKRDKQIY